MPEHRRGATGLRYRVPGGAATAQAGSAPKGWSMKKTQVPSGRPAMHLNAVMVHFGRLAALVLAPDQPLRAGHGEVASDSRVVRDDVHVRLQSDISRHGLADAVGATGVRSPPWT